MNVEEVIRVGNFVGVANRSGHSLFLLKEVEECGCSNIACAKYAIILYPFTNFGLSLFCDGRGFSWTGECLIGICGKISAVFGSSLV